MIEVEHVKAHRTEKERHMSLFEKFITEGNEKADEFAKEGAMLDGGFMVQTRSSTIQQEREREEVYAALQCAASFHCFGVGVERLCRAQASAKRRVTEWCAATSKYRCIRRGRGSKYRKM